MSQVRGEEEIFESDGGGGGFHPPAPVSGDMSRDIETKHLRPADAFDYFHGQIYDNKLTAYDNFLRNSKALHAGEVSYSLADQLERSRGAETPFQRYSRLRLEVEQLSADLEVMNKSNEGEVDGGNSVSIWNTLQSESNQLLHRITGLETASRDASNKFLGKDSQSLHSDAVALLQKTDHSDDTSGEKEGILSNQSCIDSESFSRLEQRVYAIELLLGASDTADISSMITTTQTKTFPLLENLSSLEKRVNLLDPVVLQTISSKVSQLISDIETLQKLQGRGKGKSSKGNKYEEEVADLSKKVAALDGFADELPGLLLRLKTLATIHQEAASFSSRLTEAENSIGELTTFSKSNGEVMTALQEGMVENMKTLNENMHALESRIEKIA